MTLYPYQVTAARWLADHPRSLLADEPRVGKTNAAIRACDHVWAENVFWITSGNARAGHRRAWLDVQTIPRRVTALYTEKDDVRTTSEMGAVTIASYDLAAGALLGALAERKWDAIVLDECHRLKNPEAKRTRAIYGEACDGVGGLVECVPYIWGLSGSPTPNHYGEIWSTARALFPQALIRPNGKYQTQAMFEAEYCKMANNGFGNRIVGSRNEKKFRERIGPYMLRRTYAEVWPDAPGTEVEMLYVDGSPHIDGYRDAEVEALMAEYEQLLKRATPKQEAIIMDEIERKIGARMSRLTGMAKVRPVAGWVCDRLEEGYGKIVVFAWNRDVIDLYVKAFAKYQPAVVHGGVTGRRKEAEQDRFQQDPACRVFVGQIKAAGEAIDLSAADDIVMAQSSYVPGDNDQAMRRVLNTEKKVPTRAWFATWEGSLDVRVQQTAARKAAEIAKIM